MSTYSLGRVKRQRSDGTPYRDWHVYWWEGDKRRRFGLDTEDKVEAEAKARKLWAVLQGKKVCETVGDIVEAYLGPEDRPDPVPDARRKREAWVAAKAYWGHVRAGLVDEQMSIDYPAWRNRSVNTVRQELSLVRTALRWAVPRYISEAPKVTLPPMPDTQVTHLSKVQFRQFLLGCESPHVRLFAMLGVTTGGRKSAILQSKWEQVDFDRALLQLNPKGRRQNSKLRATVPLNDMILPALREAKQAALTDYIIEHHGKPMLDIKKGIAAASKRSGVYAHPHMFRHSAAVWMAEDRVPMSEIASFLGHRDINVTTRVYARYHPDYLREAARSLTW